MLAWQNKVSEEFIIRLFEICTELCIDTDYLMACMAFETGEKFTSSVRNKVSGATGLIQFMPSTAKSLGTSVERLSEMTEVEQLTYVRWYFLPYKGKLNTLEDVYMAILWPKAVGKSDDYVLFRKGSITYKQNQGLDLNKDGLITKYEAAYKVRLALEKGLREENTLI